MPSTDSSEKISGSMRPRLYLNACQPREDKAIRFQLLPAAGMSREQSRNRLAPHKRAIACISERNRERVAGALLEPPFSCFTDEFAARWAGPIIGAARLGQCSRPVTPRSNCPCTSCAALFIQISAAAAQPREDEQDRVRYAYF
jgi:hypothetical protein